MAADLLEEEGKESFTNWFFFLYSFINKTASLTFFFLLEQYDTFLYVLSIEQCLFAPCLEL